MKVKDFFLTRENFEIVETETEGILKTFPVPENLETYYESKNYISHYQNNKEVKKIFYKFFQFINLFYKKNILMNISFKNAFVLDYGCGIGNFLKFIENDFYSFGFEPNKIARNFAKKKVRKTKIISNISEIKNKSLDVITLWHVFEHIKNQKEILNTFHQKLKKQGKLIIAVPNYTSYDAKYYKEFWAAYDVPRHIFHFSKFGMKKLINGENWYIKKIKPLLLDSFYISILSEKYKKNPIFLIKGSIIGFISNFKALKTGEFSSLIYIIEKK